MKQNNNTAQGNFELLRKLVILLSVALPLIVFVLFQFKYTSFKWPFDVHILPLINAILNGVTTVFLLGALYAIKNKNVKLHSRLIYSSMFTSVLFLLVYVLYHLTAEHTSFGGQGGIRVLYLFILASHIILAAIQTPFVLFAFLYGYTGQIEKHKSIVKFSYPIWLYVSITGVICYLMIKPYYM